MPTLVLLATLLAGLPAHAQPQQFGWVQASPQTNPSPRNFHPMAFDSLRGEVVMFGGAGGPSFPVGPGVLSDTWVWDGSNWTQRFPATVPPARYSPAFAYDEARGQVVMFGGIGSVGPNPTYLSDTWVWDGINWTQKSPATVPPARLSGAMAYDPARRQTVLFGGFNLTSFLLNDTWVWDGTNWTRQTPLVSPPVRYSHAMAFDNARGRVMLFGGAGESFLNDTWQWNGSNWLQIASATAPAGVTDFAMASDTRNNQVVLFGGQSGYLSHRSETWSWGANNWTKQSPPVVPPRRSATAMAFDSVREQVVMFGGQTIDGELGFSINDTWLYQRLTPVRISANIPTATFSVTGTYCQPGSNYPVPTILYWAPGASCTVTFTEAIPTEPGRRNAFTRWSDSNDGPSRIFIAPANQSNYDAVYSDQFLLTANVNPVSAGTATGEGWYDRFAVANITATPAPRYLFASWTGSVANPAASATTITMTRPQTVTANFTALAPVTITSATAQATFSTEGTGCAPGTYSVPQTFYWTPGTNCTVTFTTPLSAGPGTQLLFNGWADNVAANARLIAAPTVATTYTANYKTQYLLTISANPPTAGSVSDGGYFDAGTTQTITATANAGNIFAGWTGPVASPTANSTTVAITQTQTLLANFTTLIPVTITSATTQATFTVAGTGCAAGSYAVPQTLLWTPGANCTVTFATPISEGGATQFLFTGWSDGVAANSRIIPVPASATTYAASYKTQYLLSTLANPVGAGTTTGSGFYDAGTQASIVATPALAPTPGQRFVNWSGDGIANTNAAATTVLMDGPKTVTANFAPKLVPSLLWPTPAPIIVGTALSVAQLNATTSVPGTFAYTPPAGTTLPVGNGQLLSVTFFPTDATTYTTATATTTINVLPVVPQTPRITWATPAPISFGSALSSVQLNATASVPGTFAYTIAAGTVLPIGNAQVLSVLFTPTDQVNYTTAAASVLINVLPGTNTNTPSLVVTRILTRDPQTNEVLLRLTIANAGGATATNVQLNAASIGVVAPLSPSLPASLGNIPAGGQQSITLRYRATVGNTGSPANLSGGGTYAQGTFNLASRIVLP